MLQYNTRIYTEKPRASWQYCYYRQAYKPAYKLLRLILDLITATTDHT